MIQFYLGTHEPSWLAATPETVADPELWAPGENFAWFVSHRRLAGRKSLPRARSSWALDSGGFSELSLFGEWRTTPAAYVAAVERYDTEIGQLAWAAPQDWMCEAFMLAKTGLTVAEHQRYTVDNFLELKELWTADSDCPFMPVLQGWTADDYLRCADLYEQAGVRLAEWPVVGVGSVCRRQDTHEIADVLAALEPLDLALHGFGVKAGGLRRYGHLLESSDSMAWSFNARRAAPLPGCTHKNCANCIRYALRWRRSALAAADADQQLTFRLGGAA